MKILRNITEMEDTQIPVYVGKSCIVTENNILFCGGMEETLKVCQVISGDYQLRTTTVHCTEEQTSVGVGGYFQNHTLIGQ